MTQIYMQSYSLTPIRSLNWSKKLMRIIEEKSLSVFQIRLKERKMILIFASEIEGQGELLEYLMS